MFSFTSSILTGFPSRFIVELLLTHEADHNLTDERGFTLLHIACERGYVEVVKRLLKDNEVNINKQVNARCNPIFAEATAVQVAAKTSHVDPSKAIDILRALLAHPDVDTDLKDCLDRTPLEVAAFEGRLDVVKMLFTQRTRGTRTEKPDFTAVVNRCTALYWASRYDRCKNVVEFLLDEVPSMCLCRDRYGQTPLHYAVDGEAVENARLLMPEVNVNEIDDEGVSALSLLVTKSGNLDILDLFENDPRVGFGGQTKESRALWCKPNIVLTNKLSNV